MKLVNAASAVIMGQSIADVEAKEKNADIVMKELPVLTVKSICRGRIDPSEIGSVKLKTSVKHNRFTCGGDIIIKLYAPFSAAFIEKKYENMMIPSFFCAIRGIDETYINPEFLVAYLNSKHISDFYKTKIKGRRQSLNIADIKTLEIPEIPYKKQIILAEAYALCCSKLETAEQLLLSEQMLMENLILAAVKEYF